MAKTILVIDDEPAIRKMFKTILGLRGYEVTTAENGVDGLRIFKNSSFDLVITDIVMPEKEGLETIREIRGIAGRKLPILVISGGGRIMADQYLKTALALGADKALSKPIPNDVLVETVKELLKD